MSKIFHITINHRKVDRLISSNFFVIKLLVQHYQTELKMPYTISEQYRILINQYQEVYRNFDFHYSLLVSQDSQNLLHFYLLINKHTDQVHLLLLDFLISVHLYCPGGE